MADLVLEKVARDVKAFGWSLLATGGFAYTTGLTDGGHPEVLVAGLDPYTAHDVVWLPNATAFRLLLESSQLGGTGHPVAPEAFERLGDPATVAAVAAELGRNGDGDLKRFRRHGTVLPAAITSRLPDDVTEAVRGQLQEEDHG